MTSRSWTICQNSRESKRSTIAGRNEKSWSLGTILLRSNSCRNSRRSKENNRCGWRCPNSLVNNRASHLCSTKTAQIVPWIVLLLGPAQAVEAAALHHQKTTKRNLLSMVLWETNRSESTKTGGRTQHRMLRRDSLDFLMRWRGSCWLGLNSVSMLNNLILRNWWLERTPE